MSKEIYLSIIIPTKNGAHVLGQTLDDIATWISKSSFSCEVIVADSLSDDGTIEIIKKHSSKIPNLSYLEPTKNEGLGKGQGIRSGILAARGDAIMFMDQDNATKILELDNLLPYLKDYDIVMGSRYTKKPRPYYSGYFKAVFYGIKSVLEVLVLGHSSDYIAKGKQGRIRQFISRGGNLAFVFLLNQSYIDQRCGFKLYKRDVAKTLAALQKINGFGFDTEYLAIAQKFGYKTIEIPVEWYDATETKINPVKDSINSFKDIFKVMINRSKGLYSKNKITEPQISFKQYHLDETAVK